MHIEGKESAESVIFFTEVKESIEIILLNTQYPSAAPVIKGE